MKQEDLDLLLKDLCARLPYGVKVNVCKGNKEGEYEQTENIRTLYELNLNTRLCGFKEVFYHVWIANVRPYLFPLSSMTEEQKEELKQILDKVGWTSFDCRNEVFYDMGGESKVYLSTVLRAIEFFNRNHFDYNGLIERELAIDCTNLNVYV